MSSQQVILGFECNMKPQPFLFEELLIEILSWLPVKSIIKFRCVSKTWKSLISDSQFVKLHLQRSSSKNTDFSQAYLLIKCFKWHDDGIFDQEYVTYPSISSLLEGHPAMVAIRSRLNEHIFIGSCNGLISLEKADCTTEKYSSQVCFWNPATRSKSQHSPPLYDHESSRFGFGYDCSSDTYKVVAAMLFGKTMVNVYNMGDRCWRRIQVSPLPSLHLKRVAVYVSNTLNWLATITTYIMHENLGIDMYTIVSFDLGKEELIRLPLPYSPQRIDEFQDFEPILGVLRGSLSISQNDNKTHNFVLWQMKEFGVHKSWTKLFSITVGEKIIYGPCFAICMDENGDTLLFTKYGISQVALYIKKEHKLEGLKVYNKYYGRHVNNYIESLISPY